MARVLRRPAGDAFRGVGLPGWRHFPPPRKPHGRTVPLASARCLRSGRPGMLTERTLFAGGTPAADLVELPDVRCLGRGVPWSRALVCRVRGKDVTVFLDDIHETS